MGDKNNDRLSLINSSFVNLIINMYQHSLITVFDLFLNKTLIFTDFNYAATENCDGLKAVRDQKKCFT